MRVDHMSKRLAELLTRQTALDHHFALQTLFEIVDICDSRTDLKSEILKELERYRQTTLAFRGYAGVDERVMDALLERIGHCYSHLSAQMGKLSHEFNSNEWYLVNYFQNVPEVSVKDVFKLGIGVRMRF